MDDLKNKTIVLTGAAGLLGSAFAHGFANCGSTLILIDNNAKKIKNLAQNLASSNGNVVTFAKDITQKSTWNEIIEFINSKELTPDVLINNATFKSENFFDSFENYSLEDWNQVMQVNLTSYMLASQAIGARFAQQGRGSIIHIASIYGISAPDQRIYEGSSYLGRTINTPAVYSASKAAVVGLSKYLSTYWGERQVRSNCVTPGGVFSGQNDTFRKKYEEKVPLGRMANEKDIFGAVSFLASDISSYVTGQNIVVDGGWTAW